MSKKHNTADYQLSKNERIRMHSERSKKNKRRRNVIFISVLSVFAVSAIVLLSVFGLFKIEEINVSGSSIYSNEQIAEASDIKQGSGILLLNKKETAEKITSKLPYIGSVNIGKSLSGAVVLEVTDTAAAYAVAGTAGYILFDEGGKILEINAPALPAGCALVTGMTVRNPKVSVNINTVASESYATFAKLATACRDAGLAQITLFDVNDRFDISFEYVSRYTVKIGGINDIENKLIIACEAIQREQTANPDKLAVIDVASDQKAYVRNITVPAATQSQTDFFDNGFTDNANG